MTSTLKAPFPYFGGKSAVAGEVWRRFGNVPNYVEPFFGSGAVLLSRMNYTGQIETVNDLDCYLANFWRAVQADPEGVAAHCVTPVSEIDLLSRHDWLIAQGPGLRELMRHNPEHYDTKVAGWWVWGKSAWIGGGWCLNPREQLPHLSGRGQGINRKLPHLGDRGRGIAVYFASLQRRTERVRIACGDWARVLGPSVTERHGTTGIFLDPPYGEGDLEYAAGGNGCRSVFDSVAAWCVENGQNPKLRIALCGYEGNFTAPPGWQTHRWKSGGGYGNQANGQGRKNARRETIRFSPACLNQKNLFS